MSLALRPQDVSLIEFYDWTAACEIYSKFTITWQSHIVRLSFFRSICISNFLVNLTDPFHRSPSARSTLPVRLVRMSSAQTAGDTLRRWPSARSKFETSIWYAFMSVLLSSAKQETKRKFQIRGRPKLPMRVSRCSRRSAMDLSVPRTSQSNSFQFLRGYEKKYHSKCAWSILTSFCMSGLNFSPIASFSVRHIIRKTTIKDMIFINTAFYCATYIATSIIMLISPIAVTEVQLACRQFRWRSNFSTVSVACFKSRNRLRPRPLKLVNNSSFKGISHAMSRKLIGPSNSSDLELQIEDQVRDAGKQSAGFCLPNPWAKGFSQLKSRSVGLLRWYSSTHSVSTHRN